MFTSPFKALGRYSVDVIAVCKDGVAVITGASSGIGKALLV
jgi:NAD(P)-dependent dehydrogenase (short-subunit alcohol dehydrogenase family)